MYGYGQIPRDCYDLFLEDKFSRGQAYSDLFLLANFKDGNFSRHSGKGNIDITLKRGQFAHSNRWLAERWKRDKDTVKRYLDFLVKRQKLGTANIGGNNIVYSLLEYPDGDSNGDSNTPAMGTAMGTILNKDKKEKKDKSFQKPTPEEVEQYCKERSNNIDPIRFVNFYESKGRKVGNQSMKDWKACIRTREQKNKPPEPQTQEDYIKAFKEIGLVQFRKRYGQDKANEIMQVAI